MQTQPELEFLFDLSVELETPLIVGKNIHGDRRIFYVKGGAFEGPALRGKLLPGGGDWLISRSDNVVELDIRAVLQTDDDALIYVQHRGYTTNSREISTRWRAGEHIREEEYYSMITATYETSASQYAWLQQVVVIGKMSLVPGGVKYRIFAVR